MAAWEDLIPQRAREDRPLRIGAELCAFNAPLLQGLDSGRVELVRDSCASLRQMLAAFKIDCALLPLLSYARTPAAVVVPGLGIVAHGPSPAELALYRGRIEEVKRVGFNPMTGGDEALARIVFAECYGILPKFEAVLQDELPPGFDALVVSSANAFETRCSFPGHVDLVAAWESLTGLPFVNRIWVAAGRAPLPAIRGALARAHQTGMEFLPQYAAHVREKFGAAGEQYLTGTLRFSLGGDEARSIREFLRRCARHGLCEKDVTVAFC